MNYEQMINSRIRMHKAMFFVQILMIFQICIGLGYCAYAGLVLNNIEQVLGGATISVCAIFIWMAVSGAITSNLQIINQLEELAEKEKSFYEDLRKLS